MKKTLPLVLLGILLALPAQAAEFNNNLKYGLRNNADVSKLQEFLQEEGLYAGPISGNFYSLTLKAVKDFQKRESISPASGFFGNLTRTKVNTILDERLADSKAEEANEPVGQSEEVAPVAEGKSFNELVKAERKRRLLEEQLAQQQKTNQLLEETKKTLEEIKKVSVQPQTINIITTPESAVVVPATPAQPALQKAYREDQLVNSLIPEVRSGVKHVSFTNPSDKITLEFQGKNYSRGTHYITDLQPYSSYKYSWTIRESGREDSTFTRDFSTLPIERVLEGKNNVSPYDFKNVEYKSFTIQFINRNNQEVTIPVLEYHFGNQIIHVNEIKIPANTEDFSYEVPLKNESSINTSYKIINGPEQNFYANVKSVKFIGDGVEYNVPLQ